MNIINILSSKNKFINLFINLSKPKSSSEDSRRKEFILNILLLGTLALTAMMSLISLINLIRTRSLYNGLPVIMIFSVFLLFLLIYTASRFKHNRFAAFSFVCVYYVPTIYTAYRWGIEVPEVLLLNVLIIVMSGVLVGTGFSFFTTLLSSSIFFGLTYLSNNKIISPDSAWKSQNLNAGDVMVLAITLFIIAIVSWLSNREIERSLKRARKSERELKKERDQLEIKVEERTKELNKAQIEKMTQLYRFAEFGRLSSGIFHDLINPMTALSLNLERLKAIEKKEVTDAQVYLEHAFAATKRMEDFIIAIRKQIQKEETKKNFSITEEIIQTMQILNYRSSNAKVDIIFSPTTDNIEIYGDSVRFSQIILNLISNAIDSYDNLDKKEKRVLVSLKQTKDLIMITIKDSGCGIEAENISKIFDPFYSTKHGFDKGMGIGMSSTKNIIEKTFNGTITVESEPGKGSTFEVLLPYDHGIENEK